MAINLSDVNISLNEFQRLSQGTCNAGEVKLAGAAFHLRRMGGYGTIRAVKTALHSIAQDALTMRVGCTAQKWGGILDARSVILLF